MKLSFQSTVGCTIRCSASSFLPSFILVILRLKRISTCPCFCQLFVPHVVFALFASINTIPTFTHYILYPYQHHRRRLYSSAACPCHRIFMPTSTAATFIFLYFVVLLLYSFILISFDTFWSFCNFNRCTKEDVPRLFREANARISRKIYFTNVWINFMNKRKENS